MFVRAKKSGKHTYLQVVQNQRDSGKVRQQVVATLGRLDTLQAEGQIDGLLRSCAKFANDLAIVDAASKGEIPDASAVRIGPVLVFERLWKELGIQKVLQDLLGGRKFSFSCERVIFTTVLHRLMHPGSDRNADEWKSKYAIEGADQFELHQAYRAMAWLGETLPCTEQGGRTPFTPRCIKDKIEEALFARTQNLFSELEVVFFDTTSIYFEGEGGETIGQFGYSKDHRPDRKQMVVGAVIDSSGRPICCELWPGNTSDVKTLIPIVDRIRKRFGIRQVCIVADRGMISQETLAILESGAYENVNYILGARMRRVNEIQERVLTDTSDWQTVHEARKTKVDPMPLKVKSVEVNGHRYVLCLNEEQQRKDAADRAAIVASLQEKLKQGGKALVGNKGFRRYLREKTKGSFVVDEEKFLKEAEYDGKWVLRTDLDLPAGEIALKYKELWQVEAVFRTTKSILDTRPIFHQCDETIRGHVFCSFLALVLIKELMRRLAARGWSVEWDRLKDDLDSLQHVTVNLNGKTLKIRTRVQGDAGKALQAAGVALGSTVTEES